MFIFIREIFDGVRNLVRDIWVDNPKAQAISRIEIKERELDFLEKRVALAKKLGMTLEQLDALADSSQRDVGLLNPPPPDTQLLPGRGKSEQSSS